MAENTNSNSGFEKASVQVPVTPEPEPAPVVEEAPIVVEPSAPDESTDVAEMPDQEHYEGLTDREKFFLGQGNSMSGAKILAAEEAERAAVE